MSMKGAVVTTARSGVRIHSYVSPENGWLVNTHIVEGPTQLVLFDGQLLNAYAREVAGFASSLGKPLERIVISHGHPDHWAGLDVLTRHFPRVPVYALESVIATVRNDGPAMVAGLQRLFGSAVADREIVPTHVLAPGRTIIDGVTFEFREILDAESDAQLLALMPGQQLILAFDLVFAPHDHLFTTVAHFEHWIALLQLLKGIKGYDLLLVGHGGPNDFSAVDTTITYLRRCAEIYEASTDGTSYSVSLKAAFPERHQAAWADFSGRRLFPLSPQRSST